MNDQPKHTPEIIFISLLHCRGAELLSLSGRLLQSSDNEHCKPYLIREAERYIADLVAGIAQYKSDEQTRAALLQRAVAQTGKSADEIEGTL